jgi:hypothetical protein
MSTVTWSFTTAGTQTGCPCTIWPASAVPIVASDPEAVPVELGVKFRSNSAGFISGLRYYKSAANTGTHVGHLWTASGQLVATVNFTNESASGWQQANFPSPVAITANTIYVASYHTDVGHYADDVGYFSNTGVDSGPLHALADGESGPNGVAAGGPSPTFPINGFQAGNYWVDVVFSSTTSDSTPPTVTARSPAVNATGVARGNNITATFSEDVQQSTIQFTLKNPAGATIAAVLSYNSGTRTATLNPNTNLARNTKYTATVSGAKDLSGNTMSAPVTWSFTTAP